MKNQILPLILTVSIFLFSQLVEGQDSLWIEQTIPFSSGSINDIFFISPDTAWAVGVNTETNKGVILYTSDGGNNWVIQDESFTGSLNQLFIKNETEGYAVGQDWNEGYISMLKTENGTTWANHNLPLIHGNLFDIEFTTEEKGCAVGIDYDSGKALIIYTDDNETWQEANVPDLYSIFLNEITFTTQNEGWCVGSPLGDADSTFILYTTNGGADWQIIEHPVTNGSIAGMNFSSPDTGVFYGTAADTAFIMETINKGANWEFFSFPFSEITSSSQKSASLTEELCKIKILKYVVFEKMYRHEEGKRILEKEWGWALIAYICPSGKKFESRYFTIDYLENGERKVNTTSKQTLADIIVTKGVQAPTPDDDIKPLNPVTTLAGSTISSNKPVIQKSKRGFYCSIDDSDTIRTLVIVVEEGIKANICVNDKEEITVNGVSTGVSVNEVSKVEINCLGDKSEVDASCITDQNRGSIGEFEINTGSGDGPNTIVGPEASEIVTKIESKEGSTTASGGNGRGIYQVGSNTGSNGFPTMLTYDQIGNETYLNNTFSRISYSSLKSGSIKNSQTDLPTNSYTDEEGSDTLKYLNYGWPVRINLDSQSTAQQISDVQNLILEGQFENLFGSAFDDKITVKPLIDESRLIDGGSHELGDTLIFDALGLEVSDDGSSLNVEGYLPVHYINIENLIIINSPGPLSRIEIAPADTTTDIGEQVQFTAKGFDEQGLEVSINPVWTAIGGTITEEGIFTAGTEAGNFTVTATVDEVVQTANVEIKAGALEGITISPENIELNIGVQQQFSATGYDQFDNEVEIEVVWTTTGGTITSNGLFTSDTVAGDFQVTANVGDISNTADVVIKAGPLDRIEISPVNVSLEIGAQQQFLATGFDEYDNEVAIEPEWSATGGIISSEGLYSAGTLAGKFVVTTSVDEINQSATVIILPEFLSRIEVSPENVTLNIGGQQKFNATGYDEYENQISINPSWDASGGTITTEGLYSAGSESGEFSVTASVGEINQSATVTIIHGTLFRIEVSPENTILNIEGQRQFIATGFDEYDNQISINPLWDGTGGIITSEGLFTAGTEAGEFFVSATAESVSKIAAVTILPDPLSRIEIDPAFLTLIVGEQQQFSVTGFDEYGNEISVEPSWETNGGTITPDGLFTAGYVAGDYTVSAAFNEVTKSVPVTLTSGELFKIEISPASVELDTGQQQQFMAVGMDEYDNIKDISPVWAATGGEISEGGLFTAGGTEGTFKVNAGFGEIIGEATVVIHLPTGVSIQKDISNNLKLYQNYPNPFDQSTKIEYFIPNNAKISAGAQVVIKVFNYSGQEVVILVDKKQVPGKHLVELNLSAIKSNLPPGIYYYRLIFEGEFTLSRKMMVK